MGFFETRRGTQASTAILVALWLLVALFAVAIIYGLDSLRYVGTGIAATNTISVTGEGQIYATPDIATFTYSVTATKATVADAQAAATPVSNAITDYLKSQGVSANDIQTSGYDIEPQYEYQNAVCPQGTSASVSNSASPIYCPPGKQTLTGYQVSQTTTVKVRDLTKAGDLLAGVGTKGATNVSGLQFTFDDPNKPQDDARNKAIADAKSKADTLAKQLGVDLVRVTSFQESSGGYPRPIEAYATAAGSSAKAPSPEISPGQNQVTDDVTITYEIK